MVVLAQHFGHGPLMMSDISRTQGLSRKYLHALLTNLREAGLVHSVLGAKGGYYLAKSPAEIKVREIVEALEGPMSVIDCVAQPASCDKSEACATRPLWIGLSKSITQALDAVTLEQLARGQGFDSGDLCMPS
jgi:Rrf2 family protein